MEKPKTCPFCGAKLEDYDHWMYKHPENDCYLIKETEILPYFVYRKAIKDWNRRAAE